MSDPAEKVEAPAVPKQRAIALAAGGKVAGIVPQNFDDCWRISKLLAESGMVPKDFQGKPEAVCVAVMQGLEIGLAPMAAVQSIAVINGRPSLWGDGALAVVKNSGLCEWIREWSDDNTAYCETKRKGEALTVKRSFSDADAKAAGLLGKPGPWQQYRSRMRQMRARSWTIRDCYPDVLKGLAIAEEAQDIPEMKDVTPRVLAKTIGEEPDPQPAQEAPPQQEAANATRPKRKSAYSARKDGTSEVFKTLEQEIKTVSCASEFFEFQKKHAETLSTLPREWYVNMTEQMAEVAEKYEVEFEAAESSLRMS